MFDNHIRWSTSTLESRDFKEKVDNLYSKAKSLVEGYKLYGVPVNVNNPKEVIAVLLILAEDYNRFHERL